MAKQVKVFDVSIGTTSTTVYTVPAGRVAKVILERYETAVLSITQWDGVITSGEMVIGTTRVAVGRFSGEDVGANPVASTDSALSGFIPTRIGVQDNYSVAYTTRGFTRRIQFLPAGASITMRSATARFCVIEEF